MPDPVQASEPVASAASPETRQQTAAADPTGVSPAGCSCENGAASNPAVAPSRLTTALGNGRLSDPQVVAVPEPAPAPYGAAAAAGQLVFAFGEIDYDFGTEARRDSIYVNSAETDAPDGRLYEGSFRLNDPTLLLQHVRPAADGPLDPDVADVIWTLKLDGTPIYAVQGDGPFGERVYRKLVEFLDDQVQQRSERVSIAGRVVGAARLSTGQTVPLVSAVPRGMFNWTFGSLIDGAVGATGGNAGAAVAGAAAAAVADHLVSEGVRSFLERVYYQLRNYGAGPEERAINFAATNSHNVARIFRDRIRDGMELDTIQVEKSPLCRPDSQCYDVVLSFFDPERTYQRARKASRFTVDVSDVVPVLVGPPRTWSVR